MPYDDVDYIANYTPASPDNLNAPLRQLAARDDYLKSKVDVLQTTTDATFVLDVDTDAFSAPFFGYVISNDKVHPAYIKINDLLELQAPAFTVGLVRQTGAVKTLYLNGKISNITDAEITALVEEGYARPNTPLYLTGNPSNAGMCSYEEGVFAIYVGMFLSDSTFLLNIDLSDIYSYNNRQQADFRAFDLTETGTTVYDTFDPLTVPGLVSITRDPLAIAEFHRLGILPNNVLPAGSVGVGDYIRLDHTGGIAAPANYYLPIGEVSSVTVVGGFITDIYLTFDYPATNTPAGDYLVWAPDGVGIPLLADMIYVMYDASNPAGAPVCDYTWKIEDTDLSSWPGNIPDYILFFLNGVAQNHNGDTYALQDTGILYTDISFPPTFYGWEAKVEYLTKIKIEQYVKKVNAGTPNVSIGGTDTEPEINVVPQGEWIPDNSGSSAVKEIYIDATTGKFTIVKRNVVSQITAGPGIEVSKPHGALTISNIGAETQSLFLLPQHATSAQSVKPNGLCYWPFVVGDELAFVFNIPGENLNISKDTTISLAANFMTLDANHPAITCGYSFFKFGTDDDAYKSISPSINTTNMAHINSVNFVNLLTVNNSELSNKLFGCIKIKRETDSYSGLIYTFGLKIDFYA